MKKLIAALSICLVLLLGLCVALHIREAQPGETLQTVSTEPTEQTQICTVCFYVGDTLVGQQWITPGQTSQTLQLAQMGLRLTGWTDENGDAADPFATPVAEDMTYYAVAYPQLEGHRAYLFTDESGCLRPDDALTADELSLALTTLAAEGAQSWFPTLPTGSDPVTFGQLMELLASFFEADTLSALTGETEAAVTRTEFAQWMNTLLDWDTAETLIIAPGGTIPGDVTADRADAAALLEASVPHEANTTVTTTWADTKLPTAYEPGFVNIDGWLYYVQEDHYFLRDDYVGVLYFDADGRYTCGDEELDTTVAQILSTLMAEDPEADRFTILRAAYDYCHTQFRYLRKAAYDFGATGWEIEDAKEMFSTGKGNCYNFAAIFWALSRGLGYQTRAVAGTCTGSTQPHGWCIIELDGEDYFFDPEWQYAYTEREVYDKDMFMIPMDKVWYWTYRWTEE